MATSRPEGVTPQRRSRRNEVQHFQLFFTCILESPAAKVALQGLAAQSAGVSKDGGLACPEARTPCMYVCGWGGGCACVPVGNCVSVMGHQLLHFGAIQPFINPNNKKNTSHGQPRPFANVVLYPLPNLISTPTAYHPRALTARQRVSTGECHYSFKGSSEALHRPHISRGRSHLHQLGGFSGVGAIVASLLPTECSGGKGMWGVGYNRKGLEKGYLESPTYACCTDDMFEIFVCFGWCLCCLLPLFVNRQLPCLHSNLHHALLLPRMHHRSLWCTKERAPGV